TPGSTAPKETAVRGVELNEPRVVVSVDGTITATARMVGSDLRVAFETPEHDLAGRTVAFTFIHPDSGRVELSGAVTLDPVEDEPEFWKGAWQDRAEFSQPCRFSFGLVPQPRSDDAMTARPGQEGRQ